MGSLRAIGARRITGLTLVALVCGLLLLGAPPARAQTPGATVTYAAGWNLVAFPPGTDLSSVGSSLSTLQAGDTDYETIDPTLGTVTGFGYWAYFANSTNITLDAGSSFYATLAPAGSYIMVGNPSGTNPAVVSGADVVYTYDPVADYAASPLLNPGQGAWVLSNAGGAVTVSATTVGAGAAPPSGARPPAGRFYGAVTVQGAQGSSGTPVAATAASGANCGSTTVGAAPATGSNYVLDLTGSDPGCTTPASPLTFTVGGAAATVAGTSTVPDVSGATKADLSVP